MQHGPTSCFPGSSQSSHVDVICFNDFPIADVPIYNDGLSFEQAIEAIEIFAASPQCVGLASTEANPDHAEESLGDRFADAMADALMSAQRNDDQAPVSARAAG